jgi:hypothetical protein
MKWRVGGVIVAVVMMAGMMWGEETKVKLAEDGYPTGQETPEGAACDGARAFIQCNGELFKKVVIPPYGGEEVRAKLKEFVEGRVREMKEQKALPEEKRSGPKEIKVCFAARHLTLNGPASMAYALLEYHDLMFVDVGVVMRDGERFLCRSLVLMDKNGVWYFHPCPEITPLLMAGLNEETDSKERFEEKHKLKKKE